MRRGSLVAVGIALFPWFSIAEPLGQVCIASLPKDVAAQDHDSSSRKAQRREPYYEFSVEILGHSPTRLSPGGTPQLVADLPVGQRHRLVIRDRQEVIETFAFTFEARGGRRLCLAYKPFYQTWILEVPPPDARWCRCSWKA